MHKSHHLALRAHNCFHISEQLTGKERSSEVSPLPWPVVTVTGARSNKHRHLGSTRQHNPRQTEGTVVKRHPGAQVTRVPF